ncbi:MAG: hypothetical protein FWF56_00635 [Firmicutes bacterium]|nr:hypothetical protein [Bacillota bacterium]MCL1953834.1 hypothetical protein [Bacillota bacterium]
MQSTKAKQQDIDTKIFYILYKTLGQDIDVVSLAIKDNENYAKLIADWQKKNNYKILLWRGWYKHDETQITFNYYYHHYKKVLIEEMLNQVATYRIGNIINYWDKRKKTFVKIDVSIFSLFSQFVN